MLGPKRVVQLAAALVAVGFSGNAAAGEIELDSGNGFYAACAGDDVSPDEGLLCLVFLEGIAEAITLATVMNNSLDSLVDLEGGKFGICSSAGCVRFCPNPEVTHGQGHDVLIKFLKDHPEERHYPTAGLFLRAMSEAFPCPEASSKD
jgi:hypothetical protein